jgi:hypothetical protein
MHNRLDDSTEDAMNEGRGLCRVLAVGVLLAVATVAGCVFTGCALLNTVARDERVQAEFERAVARIREALADDPASVPGVPETVETPADPSSPSTADAVPYGSLNWSMGGFRGAGALQHSGAVIGSLSVKSNGMSYKWVSGGCEQLGATSKGDAGHTLACLFYKDSVGKWQGGKFDWISTSRTTRDFKNIHDGYNGWSPSAFAAATEYAFVIVGTNGRRTNVIKGAR